MGKEWTWHLTQCLPCPLPLPADCQVSVHAQHGDGVCSRGVAFVSGIFTQSVVKSGPSVLERLPPSAHPFCVQGWDLPLLEELNISGCRSIKGRGLEQLAHGEAVQSGRYAM